MIGRHIVTEQRQHAGAVDIIDVADFQRHAFEVGRITDIGRIRHPLVDFAVGHVQPVPVIVAVKDALIAVDKHVGVDRRRDDVLNLDLARPDIFQVDRLAVFIIAQRVVHEINFQ